MDEQQRVRRAQQTPAQTDAAICLTAALRLRNRSGQTGQGDRAVSLAASRLMEALGLALNRDGASIPTAARRAARRLARELQISAPPPTAGSSVDPGAQPRPRFETSDPANGRRDVPFTESIRLGRMG